MSQNKMIVMTKSFQKDIKKAAKKRVYGTYFVPKKGTRRSVTLKSGNCWLHEDSEIPCRVRFLGRSGWWAGEDIEKISPAKWPQGAHDKFVEMYGQPDKHGFGRNQDQRCGKRIIMRAQAGETKEQKKITSLERELDEQKKRGDKYKYMYQKIKEKEQRFFSVVQKQIEIQNKQFELFFPEELRPLLENSEE